MTFVFKPDIINEEALKPVREAFQNYNIRLPLFAELADPVPAFSALATDMAQVDPDTADPRNLLRVHWHNDASRTGLVDVPEHIVLPSELTGVEAKIVVALGNRFPMIHAHKVLPAYACLVQRLVSGNFNPYSNRAVWPSTGNYCRGGVAISRILECHGVAVLPEGMSQERFNWLESWTLSPNDIVRTPGTESNVKEIYDACHTLSQQPENVILNQFAEFANYAVHRAVTGAALAKIFESLKGEGKMKLAGFVSASGSSGTLAAGDHLKQTYGTDIAVVEALECPTLLLNGYGEHNIQGIGDKHVPLIHNVMNTDYVIALSEAGPDALNLVFNRPEGQAYLKDYRGLETDLIETLSNFGLSSIANILGAIKLAKYQKLGSDDVVITLATDGADMYSTEQPKALQKYFGNRFDTIVAAQAFGTQMLGASTDNMMELSRLDKERIFNLGYYTWVEQQGVSVADFDSRRDQSFWDQLVDDLPRWDALIKAF
ncbi:pyridoxal-phosphate dependent enzyme [Cohaesibacter sp. CAU 1516]|uniref:pyridoxal-phosphate dependent enzyme n=1 Tax=Cohaesibacter sp. CAU 1516 TaxID=2576038 RepID=UPI0010FD932F|nr:pyridoxal-phosphate dependent enzyme [Cohaesibacter sp. CAU 1516]TLP44121.1 pyridoxal-phosphate dependent enzyme [Cohaesibacter sp. CAU 1516]